MVRVLDDEGLGMLTVPPPAREGRGDEERDGGRGGATIDDLLRETGALEADTPPPIPAGVVEELSLIVLEGDDVGDGEGDDEPVGLVVPDPLAVGEVDCEGVSVAETDVVSEPELEVVPDGEDVAVGVEVLVPDREGLDRECVADLVGEALSVAERVNVVEPVLVADLDAVAVAVPEPVGEPVSVWEEDGDGVSEGVADPVEVTVPDGETDPEGDGVGARVEPADSVVERVGAAE